jgi:hypothetical protein
VAAERVVRLTPRGAERDVVLVMPEQLALPNGVWMGAPSGCFRAALEETLPQPGIPTPAEPPAESPAGC